MSDNVYANYQAPAAEGSGLYHKFEDGVTYTVRLASEPVVYQTEFVAPNGESNTSTKYAWKIWNVEANTAQVMQMPVTAYRQVAAYATDAEYGDPTEYNLRITRTGKAVETKYAVIASPKKSPLSELSTDAGDKLAAIDLIEAISSGKGVSNVFWLHEVGGDKKQTEVKHAIDGIMNKAPRDDMDKPINLDDIPF